MSTDIQKYHERLGLYLDRILVVTDETINLMRRNQFTNKEMVLKRKITHEDLKGISKNTKNLKEAILHVDKSHDLKIRSEM